MHRFLCSISIHALREEGDLLRLFLQHCTYLFLSTPSARRATYRITSVNILPGYFYPRPPRGGRPITLFHVSAELVISIHALREEGDRPVPPVAGRSMYFYPRPPRGGRRLVRYSLGRHPEISIHALREEGDMIRAEQIWEEVPISIHALREEGDTTTLHQHCQVRNFYPRPPRGGRPVQIPEYLGGTHFYPRPPRGGRPTIQETSINVFRFLSTPSARRATRLRSSTPSVFRDFYPRPPRGGRLDQQAEIDSYLEISIHALREEGDLYKSWLRHILVPISIHALREEGDNPTATYESVAYNFYPRPPRGGRLRDLGSPYKGRTHFYPRPPRGGRL